MMRYHTRTARIRTCLHLYLNSTLANQVPLYIAGPNAMNGTDGEVSYTFMLEGMLPSRDEQELCEAIISNVPGVHDARITKKVNMSYGRVGGNLKVVFKTRADGKPATAFSPQVKRMRRRRRLCCIEDELAC